MEIGTIEKTIAGVVVQATKDNNQNEAQRLFHGRGGCFPGLEWCVIDFFPPVVLTTLFAPPPEGFEQSLLKVFESQNQFVEQGYSLVIQHRYLGRPTYNWLKGNSDQTVFAMRGDEKFHIRLEQKNVGYFLDMEPGRKWLEQYAAGANVLNLFAYTCVFSVVGVKAGARQVVNVDMSRGALDTGKKNHLLNEVPSSKTQFLCLDILKSWSRICRRGPYEVIIIDPPSFQKGSFVATRDYAKVIKRIPSFAAPGARILFCLNAPELDSKFIVELVAEFLPQCHLVERLAGSAYFPDVDSERSLKLMHYVFDPV